MKKYIFLFLVIVALLLSACVTISVDDETDSFSNSDNGDNSSSDSDSSSGSGSSSSNQVTVYNYSIVNMSDEMIYELATNITYVSIDAFSLGDLMYNVTSGEVLYNQTRYVLSQNMTNLTVVQDGVEYGISISTTSDTIIVLVVPLTESVEDSSDDTSTDTAEDEPVENTMMEPSDYETVFVGTANETEFLLTFGNTVFLDLEDYPAAGTEFELYTVASETGEISLVLNSGFEEDFDCYIQAGDTIEAGETNYCQDSTSGGYNLNIENKGVDSDGKIHVSLSYTVTDELEF